MDFENNVTAESAAPSWQERLGKPAGEIMIRVAGVSPVTRALVLTGLAAGATLAFGSPDTAAHAHAVLAAGNEDTVNPVTISTS
ncbi:hypothetical protein Sme01_20050 [Sphaerisporangium melleum]|uniref:Uncharacterized protein n=1 Tax=Sphaerisporangium melleum TaxID=321316 RepID=A0A917RKU9_9ACTN|nr:hypothetical protein [Sphaerisporangium melleum]GGL13205.1 hypothetical protein GCM10007964_64120 [Sphaerisporangium melleum]GII69529.1 hypothetical protein Sme01_20050 [Sphaerisporangium melleum]